MRPNRDSVRKALIAQYALTPGAGGHWTQAFLEQLAACKDEEARACLVQLNARPTSGRSADPPRPAWLTRTKRPQLGSIEELAGRLFRRIDGVTHDLVYIQPPAKAMRKPPQPERATRTARELAIVDAEVKRLKSAAPDPGGPHDR